VRIPAAGSSRARARRLDPRSFDSVLTAFVEDLAARWYSKALVKHAQTVLARFFALLRESRVRDVRAVQETHVFAYARRIATEKSPVTGKAYCISTQRTHLYVLKRLFGFLEQAGVILKNPTLELVLPSWRRLPRAVLNQEQSRRLVANPGTLTPRGKRDRALLELLYGTAIRVGECERLDLGDVDLGRGQLFVRTGKGRKDRVVPLVGRAAAALDVYLRDARPELARDPSERALFITAWGTRLNVKRIQDLVRSHAKAAGLDIRVTPHTLRHGCATHLLRGGADVRHVQKLLGHSSVQTTAIYTRVTPTDLKRVIERKHPRERAWRRRTRK
jgi:integrase/recombinase XerD